MRIEFLERTEGDRLRHSRFVRLMKSLDSINITQKHSPNKADIHEQRREIEPLCAVYGLKVGICQFKPQLCLVVVRNHRRDSNTPNIVRGHPVRERVNFGLTELIAGE